MRSIIDTIMKHIMIGKYNRTQPTVTGYTRRCEGGSSGRVGRGSQFGEQA